MLLQHSALLAAYMLFFCVLLVAPAALSMRNITRARVLLLEGPEWAFRTHCIGFLVCVCHLAQSCCSTLLPIKLPLYLFRLPGDPAGFYQEGRNVGCIYLVNY